MDKQKNAKRGLLTHRINQARNGDMRLEEKTIIEYADFETKGDYDEDDVIKEYKSICDFAYENDMECFKMIYSTLYLHTVKTMPQEDEIFEQLIKYLEDTTSEQQKFDETLFILKKVISDERIKNPNCIGLIAAIRLVHKIYQYKEEYQEARQYLASLIDIFCYNKKKYRGLYAISKYILEHYLLDNDFLSGLFYIKNHLAKMVREDFKSETVNDIVFAIYKNYEVFKDKYIHPEELEGKMDKLDNTANYFFTETIEALVRSYELLFVQKETELILDRYSKYIKDNALRSMVEAKSRVKEDIKLVNKYITFFKEKLDKDHNDILFVQILDLMKALSSLYITRFKLTNFEKNQTMEQRINIVDDNFKETRFFKDRLNKLTDTYFAGVIMPKRIIYDQTNDFSVFFKSLSILLHFYISQHDKEELVLFLIEMIANCFEEKTDQFKSFKKYMRVMLYLKNHISTFKLSHDKVIQYLDLGFRYDPLDDNSHLISEVTKLEKEIPIIYFNYKGSLHFYDKNYEDARRCFNKVIDNKTTIEDFLVYKRDALIKLIILLEERNHRDDDDEKERYVRDLVSFMDINKDSEVIKEHLLTHDNEGKRLAKLLLEYSIKNRIKGNYDWALKLANVSFVISLIYINVTKNHTKKAPLYYQEGIIQLEKGNLEDGREKLEKILKLPYNQYSLLSLLSLVISLYDSNLKTKAKKIFDKYSEVNKKEIGDDVLYLYFKGVESELMQDRDAAISYYEIFIFHFRITENNVLLYLDVCTRFYQLNKNNVQLYSQICDLMKCEKLIESYDIKNLQTFKIFNELSQLYMKTGELENYRLAFYCYNEAKKINRILLKNRFTVVKPEKKRRIGEGEGKEISAIMKDSNKGDLYVNDLENDPSFLDPKLIGKKQDNNAENKDVEQSIASNITRAKTYGKAEIGELATKIEELIEQKQVIKAETKIENEYSIETYNKKMKTHTDPSNLRALGIINKDNEEREEKLQSVAKEYFQASSEFQQAKINKFLNKNIERTTVSGDQKKYNELIQEMENLKKKISSTCLQYEELNVVKILMEKELSLIVMDKGMKKHLIQQIYSSLLKE